MNADRRPETTRLRILRDYEILDTPPEPELDELAALAARVCGAPVAVLGFTEERRAWIKAAHAAPAGEVPWDPSCCPELRARGAPEACGLRRGRDARFCAGAAVTSAGGHRLGMLCVMDRAPRELDEEARAALVAVARQAMWQLEARRRILQAERVVATLAAVERRLHVQYTVASLLTEATAFEAATSRILQAISEAQGWQLGALWIVDPSGERLRCVEMWHAAGPERSEFKAMTRQLSFTRGTGLPGRVWETARPIWIPDAIVDSGFARAAKAAQDGLHGAFAFPILFGDEVLGVMEFFADAIREAPAPETMEMFVAVGRQIGQYMQRRRAEETRDRLVSILENTPDLVGTADLQRRATFLNRAGRRLAGVPELGEGASLRLDALHPAWARDRLEREGLPTALRDGVWTGESALVTPDGSEVPVSQVVIVHRDARGAPAFLSTIARDISELKRAEEALRTQAVRDPLTQLYNRRYMEESLERELSRATRAKHPLGMVMIDLDHFKRVNDTHGHVSGDAMLRALGRLLCSHTRREDVACRYGGEEFALILPSAGLEATLARVDEVRAAARALRVPTATGELPLATLSVGVATFPEHGRTADALVRSADRALYFAKASGRDRVAVAVGPE